MSPEAALARALDRVRVVATEREREALLSLLFETAAHATVVVDFLNQHAANMLARDAAFCENFMAADFILRDGIGVRVALNLSRRAAGLNMNGTDLIPRVIAQFAGHCAALPRGTGTAIMVFGTRDPWLTTGATTLAGAYPGRLVVRDGFQSDADYVAALEPYKQQRKLIVLGMGMPRQEAVAQALRQADIGPALILCGGAIIDFAAGRFARAPEWMRALGLEWLYRLGREPQRLFQRYVIGIPLFLLAALRVAAQKNSPLEQ